MNDLLYPLCAAMALLALLWRIRVLRTDRSVTQVALAANFFFLFAAFAVSTPALRVMTSEFIGVANFSGLLARSCLIVMTACQQLLLLHLRYPPEIAQAKSVRRLIATGIVLMAMAVLFMGAAAPGEASDHFATGQARYTPADLIICLAAFTVSQVEIGFMVRRCAKIAPSLWLRRGLRLVHLALPFALFYVGLCTADIAAARFARAVQFWEPAAQLGLAVATLLQILGWILPDLGPHLTSVANRLRYRRIHRELTPLHRAVTEQVPGIVIEISPSLDLRTRLYRRVIEIRDAQWALHTWMDSEVAVAAREEAEKEGMEGEELAAVVEAAQISAAIEAKRKNSLPARIPETPLVATPGDLAAELAFQRRLARAMCSPAVRRAVRRATGPVTDPVGEEPG